MESKRFLLLAIFLILGLGNLAHGYVVKAPSMQCAVQPRARVNCGYPYISQEACQSKGCCFDSSIVGVIWCFFPANRLVKNIEGKIIN